METAGLAPVAATASRVLPHALPHYTLNRLAGAAL